MPRAALALLVLVAATAHAETPNLPAAARHALDRAKLAWQLPPGWRLAPAKQNRAMEYDFAMTAPKGKLEVRYAVRSGTDSSSLFEGLFTTTILNLAAGEDAPLTRFPPRAVASEFGAIEGMTATFAPKAAGWTGFQRCMMVGIRQTTGAAAYIFFLFDDLPAVSKELERVFHALRFAPP